MKEKAIAKTHKPTALFKSNTCPIVGAEKLDELLISITKDGLEHLINTVKFVINKIYKNKYDERFKRLKEYSFKDKIDIKSFWYYW